MMGQVLPLPQPALPELLDLARALAKQNDMAAASSALAEWMDTQIEDGVELSPSNFPKSSDAWYMASALVARRLARTGELERWTDYNVLSAMYLAPLRPGWARNGTPHPTVTEIRTSMA